MTIRLSIIFFVLFPLHIVAQSNAKLLNDTIFLPYRYGVIIQEDDTIDIVELTTSTCEHIMDVRAKDIVDLTTSNYGHIMDVRVKESNDETYQILYTRTGVESIKKSIKYAVKSNGDIVLSNSASYDSIFSKALTHKKFLESDKVDTIYNCINWSTKIPKNLECKMDTYQEYYDFIRYPLYVRRLFYTYHLHKMNENALNIDSTPKLRVLFPEHSGYQDEKVYGLTFSIYNDSIVCTNKTIDICDTDYYKVSYHKLGKIHDKKMRNLLSSISEYSGYDMTKTIGFVSNPVLIEYFNGESTATYLIDKEFDKPDKKLWNVYNEICQLAMMMFQN